MEDLVLKETYYFAIAIIVYLGRFKHFVALDHILSRRIEVDPETNQNH